MKKIFLITLMAFLQGSMFAQITAFPEKVVDYRTPVEYLIKDVDVKGLETLDERAVVLLSGLIRNTDITIPGEDVSNAIRNLWKQKLFTHVEIQIAQIVGNEIFLEIHVKERPRLNKFSFTGAKKNEVNNIREQIGLRRGKQVSDDVKMRAANTIRAYFIEKGYFYVTVDIEEKPSTEVENSVDYIFKINKGKKIKIDDIIINGNEFLPDGKIRSSMKDTKRNSITNIFKSSKFIKEAYKVDKENVIGKYNELGYRDAKIASDSIALNPDKTKLTIYLNISEGNQYYFRNITWSGNTVETSGRLDSILSIRKGDVYNKTVLESRLYMNPAGLDVSSVYMDKGYLAFTPMPVEILIENDSIDIEIRINEGKEYRINKVPVSGNTKTHDHVIVREIRTLPGALFNRNDIIRSQRELANLGYFNPEGFGINPIQNATDGTVNIEYKVEERPSDQVELSGGFGAGRLVGSLGLTFNNFSMRKICKKGAWQPLPSGDGQKLSLRGQTTGVFYSNVSLSFVEPWLGGRKPNSLAVSAFWSQQVPNGESKYATVDGVRVPNPSRQSMTIWGVSAGLGTRLKKPDDMFTFYAEARYELYDLVNFGSIFVFSNGMSNNLNFKFMLTRQSIDQPFYPRSGSDTKFVLKLTPPYSIFDGRSASEYADLSPQELYKWVEYYKFKFTSDWYLPLSKDKQQRLVLKAKIGFGFLGFYNPSIGASPFERFYLGGSGLSNIQFDGREIIALRGYEEFSVSPTTGATVIQKYTMELRYLISPNPNATVFVLGFAEAGNSWDNLRKFNPFNNVRQIGGGIRIFLPMFGMMGLDYGYGLDELVPMSQYNGSNPKGRFNFTLGMNLGEL